MCLVTTQNIHNLSFHVRNAEIKSKKFKVVRFLDTALNIHLVEHTSACIAFFNSSRFWWGSCNFFWRFVSARFTDLAEGASRLMELCAKYNRGTPCMSRSFSLKVLSCFNVSIVQFIEFTFRIFLPFNALDHVIVWMVNEMSVRLLHWYFAHNIHNWHYSKLDMESCIRYAIPSNPKGFKPKILETSRHACVAMM